MIGSLISTSIIILTAGQLDYLKKCLKSIFDHTTNCEVIIVINGYYPDTVKYLKSLGWADLKLLMPGKNLGFPKGCNIGAKFAKCKYLCFLNDDTIVTPGWLDNMLACFNKHVDCGMVGPSTCYSRGEQCSTVLMSERFKMSEANILAYASNLPEGEFKTELYGFCMLIRKDLFKKVDGFYEGYGLGSYEENDLQLRFKKLGYFSYWVRNSYVHHYGHVTYEGLGINIGELVNKNKPIFERRKIDIRI